MDNQLKKINSIQRSLDRFIASLAKHNQYFVNIENLYLQFGVIGVIERANNFRTRLIEEKERIKHESQNKH